VVSIAQSRPDVEARTRDLFLGLGTSAWLGYTYLYPSLSTFHAVIPTCPFLLLTGHPCPFCGGTRSFANMWHGDVGRAAALYPLGPALFWAVVAAIPVLAAALVLPPANGLRRWTYHYLFGLIAVTGLRLSEAIGLQRSDVNLDEGVLTVRQSKFGKSRLVPLHRTTREALLSYAERRDAHLGSRCGPHFFVAERGGRLLHQYVHRVFWRLSREIGLRRPGDHTGPRVHDFRHRFAIRTLLDGYRKGIDVEQQLPVLSTYLGHACVRDTYWYLSACPELMEQAARRLDRRWEAKP